MDKKIEKSETSKRIKLLRQQAGLKQEEMGQIVGVSKSSISEYESGDTAVSIKILRRYADHFHVSIDYLSGKDSIDPQASVSFYSREEMDLILKYRRASLRKREIIQMVLMGDREYLGLLDENHQPAALLSDNKNNTYKGDKKGKK